MKTFGIVLGAVALLLAAVVIGGCEGTFLEEELEGGGRQASSLDVDLSGAYHLSIRSESQLEDLLTGEEATTLTRIQALVTASQGKDRMLLTTRVCRLDLPQVAGYQLALPSSVVSKMRPVTIMARLDATRKLTSEPFAVTLGLKLADPLHGAVPRAADAPEVFDEDGDWSPGVSVKAGSLVKIYVGIRLRLALAGTIEAAAEATAEATVGVRPSARGSVELDLDRQIYGDNIPFYDVAALIAEAESTTRLVSSSHSFVLTPVAAGTTCAGLLDQ